jgi:hypothetical protein
MVALALLLCALGTDPAASPGPASSEVVEAAPRPTIDLEFQVGRVLRPTDLATASQIELEGGYEPLEGVVADLRVSAERWNQAKWSQDASLMPGGQLMSKEGIVRPWLSFHTGLRALSVFGSPVLGWGMAGATGVDFQLSRAFGLRAQVGLDVLMPGAFEDLLAWVNAEGGLTWSF